MTVEIRGIVKSFGRTKVLRGVDLACKPGSVHALLGANGAGKSTLIECLAGTHGFDDGAILIDGTTLGRLSPTRAFAEGIAVIHQHLGLVEGLSVADNFFLGHERTRVGFLDKKGQSALADRWMSRFGLDVSSSRMVGDLPIGTKQLVAISKAWHRAEVKVLVLDEPTAALTATEVSRLFVEINRIARGGARVIYTTHRLAEVHEIADEVTVLRDGRVQLNGKTRDVDPREIVTAISGHAAPSKGHLGVRRTGEPARLDVVALSGPRFENVSLTVASGEIVGLAGILGSGRSSLLETLAGRFLPSRGNVLMSGEVLTTTTPRAALGAGIAFVPSDRKRFGIWATMDARDNLLMAVYGRSAWFGIRRRKAEDREFDEVASAVALTPPDRRRVAAAYSGGNQQKLVLGRWLALGRDLNVLLLDEPTQGVDVGARAQIYDVCRALAAQGVAILFASSDESELIELADRVVLMEGGQTSDTYDTSTLTERELIVRVHGLGRSSDSDARRLRQDGNDK